MNLISKKTTLKESIPLISLMSAFILILNVLGTYIPFSSLIIVLLLSLPSLFIGLLISKKYYYIYFLTSFLLSLLSSFNNFSFLISFTLPSLFIGVIEGIFIDKKINYCISILISTFIYFSLEIAFIPLSNLLLNEDSIELILRILGLETKDSNYYLIYDLILISSFLGIMLSSLIIYYEILKFNLSFSFDKIGDYILSLICVLTCIITLIIFFLNKNLSSIFFVISFISFILLIMNNCFIKEYKFLFLLIIIIPIYLIFVFLKIEEYSLIYFLIYPCLYSLFNLIYPSIKSLIKK